MQQRRRRARVAGAGLAIAASIALALGLAHRNAPGPMGRAAAYHGVVTGTAGARFSRISGAPDELVVLEAGSIHVEVSPLGHGERFRVRAGDGEVEVRGTAFDVRVEAGHLTSVEVQHGRVAVHGASGVSALLRSGETWRATPALPPSSSAAVIENPPAVPRSGPTLGGRPSPASTRAAAPAHREPDVVASPSAAPVVGTPPSTAAEPAAATDTARPAEEARRGAPAVLPVPGTSPVPNAAPPSNGTRDRDEERRERREERRERYDQRRLR